MDVLAAALRHGRACRPPRPPASAPRSRSSTLALLLARLAPQHLPTGVRAGPPGRRRRRRRRAEGLRVRAHRRHRARTRRHQARRGRRKALPRAGRPATAVAVAERCARGRAPPDPECTLPMFTRCFALPSAGTTTSAPAPATWPARRFVEARAPQRSAWRRTRWRGRKESGAMVRLAWRRWRAVARRRQVVKPKALGFVQLHSPTAVRFQCVWPLLRWKDVRPSRRPHLTPNSTTSPAVDRA